MSNDKDKKPTGTIKFKKKYLLYGIPAILIIAVLSVLISLPGVSILKEMNPRTTSLIRYKEKGKKKKTILNWVSMSAISKYVVNAVIIAEDDKFYHHSGFDFEALKKSLNKNLKNHRIISGASTITQQLAKNLYLTPRKSIFRKLREALITFKMERVLSKNRILEIYLNVIEFGRRIYGLKSAAYFYFKKSPRYLNLEESIRLVSILPNPVRFSPLSNRSRRMNKKRRTILNRMFKRKMISEEDYSLVAEKFK
jgi:monofunctional biosynthetic peptidoglycan transglycosylase